MDEAQVHDARRADAVEHEMAGVDEAADLWADLGPGAAELREGGEAMAAATRAAA